MSKLWKYVLGLLILMFITAVLAWWSLPDNNLHIIACDVGQGDGFLIQRGTTQVIVDGGPNRKILDCLGKYMPFWDRKVELVVLSHSHSDHYAGLIDVFEHYKVENFLSGGFEDSTPSFRVLENAVGGGEAEVLVSDVGNKLRIGLMYLDILFVGQASENDDQNEASMIFNLKYGDFEALFTGDASPDELGKVISNGGLEDVEYIKVPHHGSKNGLTSELLDIVKPEVAVISVGKNSWGHPHEEILKMLKDRNIKILRTDMDGNIEVVTNGSSFW